MSDGSEQSRTFSRAAFDPLLCYSGEISLLNEAQSSAQNKTAPPSITSNPQFGNASSENTVRKLPYGLAVPLVSNVLHENLAREISGALDSLCPPLSTSVSLSDKAFRVVMSVGIDLVIVDAVLSATLGKLRLSQQDMLTADDTEDIFGTFMVPDPRTPE